VRAFASNPEEAALSRKGTSSTASSSSIEAYDESKCPSCALQISKDDIIIPKRPGKRRQGKKKRKDSSSSKSSKSSDMVVTPAESGASKEALYRARLEAFDMEL
jgi:hypothetical protein